MKSCLFVFKSTSGCSPLSQINIREQSQGFIYQRKSQNLYCLSFWFMIYCCWVSYYCTMHLCGFWTGNECNGCFFHFVDSLSSIKSKFNTLYILSGKPQLLNFICFLFVQESSGQPSALELRRRRRRGRVRPNEEGAAEQRRRRRRRRRVWIVMRKL